MGQPMLAIVQINVAGQVLQDGDIQAIEAILRNAGNVNNLSIHSSKMTFFLWGQECVNYKTLDQIKEALKNRRSIDFSISAEEYKKTDKSYHSVALENLQGEPALV